MSRVVVAQGVSLFHIGGPCAAKGFAHDYKRTLSGSLGRPGTIIVATRNLYRDAGSGPASEGTAGPDLYFRQYFRPSLRRGFGPLGLNPSGCTVSGVFSLYSRMAPS